MLHLWSSFSDSDRGYLLPRKLHAVVIGVFIMEYESCTHRLPTDPPLSLTEENSTTA